MATAQHETRSAGVQQRRRIFVYNGGFLWQRRLRRILKLAGYDIRIGWPAKQDRIAIWGNSPTSHRGKAVSERSGAALIRVEDALLRSLQPGRAGNAPVGLLIDQTGLHFDPSTPSDLEVMLQTAPLDDTHLLSRARAAIERIRDAHLTKYTGFEIGDDLPAPGYVLVIDQTRGDASVTASGADRARFQEMLVMAQAENPGAPILIKTHPETQQGFRPGYFDHTDVNERISLWEKPISPWLLFEGAVAVYTVSSQMGFEAIFAGHKPRIFGQPFYIGWGLTEDEYPLPRRRRNLTRAQLFAGAMIDYPIWYDPIQDALCELENVIDYLEAEARAWREDHLGWQAENIRLWKRPHFQAFFGRHRPVKFGSKGPGKRKMIWGSAESDGAVTRVEDGFLRSKGLGAELVPPLSLILDDLGIYYDPGHPSRLEALIAQRAKLSDAQHERARRLIEQILKLGVSKYNLVGHRPSLPEGYRILVPGQVEDDASILKGAREIQTNLALLEATRKANPDAILIYKPHPDVRAGLRDGHIDANHIADIVLEDTDISQLLDLVDEVATMTSLTGFEALLRGRKVTTYGVPFYAGWGLTTDLAQIPQRRQSKPSLEALVHAALIDYPRYHDPISGHACSVECAIARLSESTAPVTSLRNRLLAKLQGRLASYRHLWR